MEFKPARREQQTARYVGFPRETQLGAGVRSHSARERRRLSVSGDSVRVWLADYRG